MKFAALTILSALACASTVYAQSAAQKVAALRSAPTSNDRIRLLQDSEFVFDFLHQSVGETLGAAGHTVAASSANFPALIGNGMAMTIGFLGPCGYNTPHTHPRATEFNFAVNGSLQGGVLVENGARFIFNEIPPGTAAIFPKGAIHFEFNNACEDALFVAAFNDEDPGVDQIAQRFFGLPPTFVAAALGGNVGVQEVAGLEALIPDNIALGTDECLKRCGLSRDGQPTLQRQPRNSFNALPAGFTGPDESKVAATGVAPPGNMTWAPAPTVTITAQPTSGGSSAGSLAASSSDGDKKTNTLMIVLIVIISVLAAGYLAIAAMYFYKQRQQKQSRTRGNTYFKTGADFAPQAAIFDSEKSHPFESYNRSTHDITTPYDSSSRPGSPNKSGH